MKKKIKSATLPSFRYVYRSATGTLQSFSEKTAIEKEIKDPAAVSNGTEVNRRTLEMETLFQAEPSHRLALQS